MTRLRVDKDKPKGWFKGNWKGDYSKLCCGLPHVLPLAVHLAHKILVTSPEAQSSPE